MNATIKDLAENTHPIHKRYCSYWQFLLSSYEGGIDYTNAAINEGSSNTFWNKLVKIFAGGTRMSNPRLSGNLFPHKKERMEDFSSRVEQSYYYNFCAPIIDIYTNHLFKQPITEEFGNITQTVEKRMQNIDRMGSSVDEFRRHMACLAQLYGHIFVVVDMPKSKGEQSLQEVILNNRFPYFNIYHPQQVLNWALDEFGRPYWVLLAEYRDSAVMPENADKERKLNIQYRLWTRDNWELYNADFELIDGGDHKLGVVPIETIFNKPSKKCKNFLGISEISDIAFISRDIYNSCSELKQILRDQTFSFLAVQGKATDYDEATVGTSKGLLYPDGANVPQYVSPPAANAEVYFNYIDRQVKKIFQMAKLEGGSGEGGQEEAVQKSGIAKAWDFNQTNSALSQKANNMNDGEVKLWNLFALWEDKEFDGTIEYPNEFSIQSVNEDLDEAEKMAKLNLGKEADYAIKETIIKKKFPRATEEDIDMMIESMKSAGNGQVQTKRLADRLGLFKTGSANAREGVINGN